MGFRQVGLNKRAYCATIGEEEKELTQRPQRNGEHREERQDRKEGKRAGTGERRRDSSSGTTDSRQKAGRRAGPPEGRAAGERNDDGCGGRTTVAVPQ